MRRRSPYVAVVGAMLLLGAVGVSRAEAAGFEGIIQMVDESGMDAVTQKFSFKGEKLRMEEVGPHADGSAIIFDGSAKSGLIIDPEEKAYFPLPWPTRTGEELAAEKNFEVTKLGKQDKVAGQTCELYLEKDKLSGGTTELCIAKGLGSSSLFGLSGSDSPVASLLPSWLGEMVKDGAFPIRSIERDKDGKVVSRFYATKIEAKKVDDKAFAPPAGYRRLSMEEFSPGADRK